MKPGLSRLSIAPVGARCCQRLLSAVHILRASLTSLRRAELRMNRSPRARALTPRSEGGPIIVCVFPVPVCGAACGGTVWFRT